MNIIGIDVGGANLKFATLEQQAHTIKFPLWKSPELLEEKVAEGICELGGADLIALTMTGELADCFPSKSSGVEFIINAVLNASSGRPVLIWQTAGEFVEPQIAIEFPTLTAASNWHALATWGARITLPNQTGLLIDAGSTTVDLVPLSSGSPIPNGMTDLERLISGELVYTGGLRTPLMSICSEILLDGQTIPIAAEHFATTQDIYLLTGELDEANEACETIKHETADGRPANKLAAAQRLARMLCADADDFSQASLKDVAEQFAVAQVDKIRSSVQKVIQQSGKPSQLLISGSSSYLVKRLLATTPELADAQPTWLSDQLGPEIATAACAFALAQLAAERIQFS